MFLNSATIKTLLYPFVYLRCTKQQPHIDAPLCDFYIVSQHHTIKRSTDSDTTASSVMFYMCNEQHFMKKRNNTAITIICRPLCGSTLILCSGGKCSLYGPARYIGATGPHWTVCVKGFNDSCLCSSVWGKWAANGEPFWGRHLEEAVNALAYLTFFIFLCVQLANRI